CRFAPCPLATPPEPLNYTLTMAQIIIDIRGLEDVKALLADLKGRAVDLSAPLKSFGVHMVRSVQKNFEAGGRPVQWIPSRRARRRGGKTLIDTARLMRSVVSRVLNPSTLAVGTSVIYARVHQFGVDRTVTVPDTVRIVRQAFGRPISPRQVLFKSHRRRMRIPARPFLVFQEEDLQILRKILVSHLTKRGGGEGVA
ncbi:MAG: phage virion morphogenesis protein, partial [Rhodospirillales bacterium]